MNGLYHTITRYVLRINVNNQQLMNQYSKNGSIIYAQPSIQKATEKKNSNYHYYY